MIKGVKMVISSLIYRLGHIFIFLLHVSFPIMHLLSITCMSNYAQHKMVGRGLPLTIHLKGYTVCLTQPVLKTSSVQIRISVLHTGYVVNTLEEKLSDCYQRRRNLYNSEMGVHVAPCRWWFKRVLRLVGTMLGEGCVHSACGFRRMAATCNVTRGQMQSRSLNFSIRLPPSMPGPDIVCVFVLKACRGQVSSESAVTKLQ